MVKVSPSATAVFNGMMERYKKNRSPWPQGGAPVEHYNRDITNGYNSIVTSIYNVPCLKLTPTPNEESTDTAWTKSTLTEANRAAQDRLHPPDGSRMEEYDWTDDDMTEAYEPCYNTSPQLGLYRPYRMVKLTQITKKSKLNENYFLKML